MAKWTSRKMWITIVGLATIATVLATGHELSDAHLGAIVVLVTGYTLGQSYVDRGKK